MYTTITIVFQVTSAAPTLKREKGRRQQRRGEARRGGGQGRRGEKRRGEESGRHSLGVTLCAPIPRTPHPCPLPMECRPSPQRRKGRLHRDQPVVVGGRHVPSRGTRRTQPREHCLVHDVGRRWLVRGVRPDVREKRPRPCLSATLRPYPLGRGIKDRRRHVYRQLLNRKPLRDGIRAPLLESKENWWYVGTDCGLAAVVRPGVAEVLALIHEDDFVKTDDDDSAVVKTGDGYISRSGQPEARPGSENEPANGGSPYGTCRSFTFLVISVTLALGRAGAGLGLEPGRHVRSVDDVELFAENPRDIGDLRGAGEHPHRSCKMSRPSVLRAHRCRGAAACTSPFPARRSGGRAGGRTAPVAAQWRQNCHSGGTVAARWRQNCPSGGTVAASGEGLC
eukprot:gene8870-biopygen3752